jgi:hypothetical protein
MSSELEQPDMVNRGARIGRAALALSVAAACALGVAIWSFTGNAEPPDPPENCPATAAAAFGWGTPTNRDSFYDAASLNRWWLYNGPGHAGNGRRTPEAITAGDGVLTITGDDAGTSGGMALKGPGQVYGRWEVCAKSPPAAPTYHSVLLLWPDAENWPIGGEIDFMEISDPQRQNVGGYLHFGADDQREGTSVQADATQWHSWAVEWTAERIVFYLDGVPWWKTTDTVHFPSGPMHLCMQVDNFGGDTRGGGQLFVDWAREYKVA